MFADAEIVPGTYRNQEHIGGEREPRLLVYKDPQGSRRLRAIVGQHDGLIARPGQWDSVAIA